MAEAKPETIVSEQPVVAPLQTMRFNVSFMRDYIDGKGGGKTGGEEFICNGAFSEVTGLEASMEVKTIKEGGANYGGHQRAGQVTFSTVVLKRGVTAARDLWWWWQVFSAGGYAHRLTVRITLGDLTGKPVMTWMIERAMPVKFKAADFNAKGTEVGFEELHLAHEGLTMVRPDRPLDLE
jgi:phage tail-like protein